MVKHTQAIGRQQPTNCLSVFDHFVELSLKGLNHFVPLLFSCAPLETLENRSLWMFSGGIERNQ